MDMPTLFDSVKNWGKWGDDDQRGALNTIQPHHVASAARLIADGVNVSCALEFPTRPAPDNPRPAMHMMVVAGDVCTETDIPGMNRPWTAIGVASTVWPCRTSTRSGRRRRHPPDCDGP